jgi:hypothetical protein
MFVSASTAAMLLFPAIPDEAKTGRTLGPLCDTLIAAYINTCNTDVAPCRGRDVGETNGGWGHHRSSPEYLRLFETYEEPLTTVWRL